MEIVWVRLYVVIVMTTKEMERVQRRWIASQILLKELVQCQLSNPTVIQHNSTCLKPDIVMQQLPITITIFSFINHWLDRKREGRQINKRALAPENGTQHTSLVVVLSMLSSCKIKFSLTLMIKKEMQMKEKQNDRILINLKSRNIICKVEAHVEQSKYKTKSDNRCLTFKCSSVYETV